ncbi:phage tail protein [Sphingobium sp. JS3065]|uniref:phage tail protein n=1 Tax=Sphingobium sp. JS3065 TaxID=2970925 RepID=UPI002265145F|nr:phage tail protein [Sphingobium sp. JS3065]UZW53886.1 phage tail protein [Sphingobium sp. JS3065]
MATIMLTALGTAIGGPLGGAIGGLIGNAFDHAVLFKPKGVEGRRLTEVQVQTSTYGSQIPRLFGTMRVAGTVIWATDLKETRHRSGGGKGRPSVTSYSYSASFAVALSARAVRAVRRVWADGNLLRGAAGDFKTELGAFRLHMGGEDQAVDPLIAAAEGLGLTPGHRGIAYAVFEDLALADYGNRIPSLTFEIEADEGAVPVGGMVAELSGGMLTGDGLGWVDGMAASGRDVGDALAPLAEAFDLAFVAEEGGLRLRASGAEGGAVVGAAGLCRAVNGRALDGFEQSGGAADGVPVALSVRYYDAARDYQAGVQRIGRPGPGRLEQGVDLPVVLSGQDARALAARKMAMAWTGRATMTLRCGWDALRHGPGDVVTVEGVPGLWRIEEREWEAMAVRLALRRVPGAGTAIPAGASSGAVVRQTDRPHGPTTLMLADLPLIRDGLATAPVVVAAASGGEGWRGAALFAIGATGEASPVGRTAGRAVMGRVDAPLPAGSATLIDAVHAVQVTLLAADMELHGADEAALALGRNLCLVGRELIQFSHAVQTGEASFRLEGLRRGLFGTEWAMAFHEAGEHFLLLEEDRLIEPFAAYGGVSEMGGGVRVAAIGVGDSEPSEALLTVSGEAVAPPSPVHVTARPDGGGGWTVGWTRRSRNGWRWTSGTDVPLGEDREAYELTLWAGADAVRRIVTDQPVWTYDAAAVAEDMGSGGEVAVEVRQIGSHALGRAARIVLVG